MAASRTRSFFEGIAWGTGIILVLISARYISKEMAVHDSATATEPVFTTEAAPGETTDIGPANQLNRELVTVREQGSEQTLPLENPIVQACLQENAKALLSDNQWMNADDLEEKTRRCSIERLQAATEKAPS